jgi:uncharacterized alkaline shock family protein YloU
MLKQLVYRIVIFLHWPSSKSLLNGNREQTIMDNVQESIGRIEVAPDVLVTIAHFASLRVEGVAKMASIPADVARLFRRESRKSGILLNLTDDNKVKFDIYVIMSPHVNIMETSKRLQTAVAEAINTMVGISVEAVDVHVEDVVYATEELAH